MKNTIKVERAKRNMTQEQLANEVGVSRQSINAIETGRFIPTTILALKIARTFECKVEDIFELEEGD